MKEFPAHVQARGGRKGRVWNESRTLDLAVIPPGVAGTGVTPEEMIAAAWGSCYGSAYAAGARAAGISVDPQISVEVVLGVEDNEYTITRAALTLSAAPEDDPAVVREVSAVAHARCPISKVLEHGGAVVTVDCV